MGAHAAPSPVGHLKTQAVRFVRIFVGAFAVSAFGLIEAGQLTPTTASLSTLAALIPASAEVALRQFRKTTPATTSGA
jgi:hypothetical protein